MIANLEVRTANKGRNMGRKYAMFRIEDFTGPCGASCGPTSTPGSRTLVTADAVHLFEGTLNRAPERAEPDFQVKKVLTIDEARTEFTKSLLHQAGVQRRRGEPAEARRGGARAEARTAGRARCT